MYLVSGFPCRNVPLLQHQAGGYIHTVFKTHENITNHKQASQLKVGLKSCTIGIIYIRSDCNNSRPTPKSEKRKVYVYLSAVVVVVELAVVPFSIHSRCLQIHPFVNIHSTYSRVLFVVVVVVIVDKKIRYGHVRYYFQLTKEPIVRTLVLVRYARCIIVRS